MIGTYQSPLGQVLFIVDQGYLSVMKFDEQKVHINHDPLIQTISAQLDYYFHHQLKTFDLPIQWQVGTVFQHKVWDALLQIPYGKTLSYTEIARQIGHPKAVRAVGQACKRNPIGIVVPCHRVIGKDGSLTGYSGKAYINLKKQLLDHESSQLKKGML